MKLEYTDSEHIVEVQNYQRLWWIMIKRTMGVQMFQMVLSGSPGKILEMMKRKLVSTILYSNIYVYIC